MQTWKVVALTLLAVALIGWIAKKYFVMGQNEQDNRNTPPLDAYLFGDLNFDGAVDYRDSQFRDGFL